MGYEVYKQKISGFVRWAGYGVPAYCDHPECNNVIDRGLGWVCCDDNKVTGSCGGFFCSDHQHIVIDEDDFTNLSEAEIQKKLAEYGLEEMPEFDNGIYLHCQHHDIQYRELASWVLHVTTDESWNEWRTDNPELLIQMQQSALKDVMAQQKRLTSIGDLPEKWRAFKSTEFMDDWSDGKEMALKKCASELEQALSN